jgi:hypothetical protein
MPETTSGVGSLWIGPAEIAGDNFNAWLHAENVAVAVQTFANVAGPLIQEVVLALEFPGQFRAGDIAALQAAFPLARISCLRGDWARGELRGELLLDLPDWHESGGETLIPATASSVERILQQSKQPLPRGNRSVQIVTSRWDSAELLIEACTLLGYAPEWKTDWSATQKSLVLWEPNLSDYNGDAELPRVALGVALVGFPTAQVIERLHNAGFLRVVAKPWRLHDLAAALSDTVRAMAATAG